MLKRGSAREFATRSEAVPTSVAGRAGSRARISLWMAEAMLAASVFVCTTTCISVRAS